MYICENYTAQLLRVCVQIPQASHLLLLVIVLQLWLLSRHYQQWLLQAGEEELPQCGISKVISQALS